MPHYATARLARGQILIPALVVLSVVFILTGALLANTTATFTLSERTLKDSQVLNFAEAGVDFAIRSLNESGTVTETETTLGNGTFIVRDLTGSGNQREIESTGYFPNATNPKIVKRLRVNAQITGESVEFFYGVQVGGGGLQMANSAQINGNVFSNGNIIGANSAKIMGDVVVAGGLGDTPTLEWASENADQFFATSSSNRDIAQSFTATTTGNVSKVAVFLGKVGSPTNSLTVRIATDNAGRPSTNSLGTTTIPATSVGLTPSFVEATFSSAPVPTVTNGSKYWLVLDYNSNSATSYWNWRKDASDAYPNNTGKYTSNCCSGNPTWSNAGGDLTFRVWIGGNATKIQDMQIGDASSGNAHANEFVNTTVHGTLCPNQYCTVDNQSQQPLPISDGVITDWKNIAEAGGVQNGDYNLSGSQTVSLGPKKIVGDMILSNQSILTLTGTVWVTGNVYVSNTSRMKLDPGYGSSSGVMVSDGVYTISNETGFEGSGEAGSYIMLLAARDAKTEISIYASNPSVGVVYYAGKSQIQFSNLAQAKEATAWGITMSNNTVVNYESGLANIFFTSGPGGGWSVESGSWREVQGN